MTAQCGALRTCFMVPTFPHDALSGHRAARRKDMGKGLLLWLIGVPIPVIILLWLVLGHR